MIQSRNWKWIRKMLLLLLLSERNEHTQIGFTLASLIRLCVQLAKIRPGGRRARVKRTRLITGVDCMHKIYQLHLFWKNTGRRLPSFRVQTCKNPGKSDRVECNKTPPGRTDAQWTTSRVAVKISKDRFICTVDECLRAIKITAEQTTPSQNYRINLCQ